MFIGLGGSGKSTFKKMILDAVNNPKKPKLIVVDCSGYKKDIFNSNNIPMEEKTNE